MPTSARLVASGSILLAVACGRSEARPPPPVPTVLVAPAEIRDLPLSLEVVGTVDGFANVDVRARVRGYLSRQLAPDGAAVREGDLLFTIEDDEYQAAAASARAGLSQALATQEHAGVVLARKRDLIGKGAVSQQELDDAVAQERVASAQVAVARAAVRQAELNLSYTRIRSPISGILGIAAVRPGNLVGQDGPTVLGTVSQLDPVRVTFAIGELDYVRAPRRLTHPGGRDLAWARRQLDALARGERAEGGDPGVELILSDGSVHPHRGVIVAANRQIDAATGTLQLEALFPNPDGLLRPGQYARVRVPRPDEGARLVTVPEKALLQVQGTYALAVVGEGGKVQIRRVEVGPSAGGFRAVRAGVKAGERVVVDGLQKAQDGATVNPQPTQLAAAAGAAAR